MNTPPDSVFNAPRSSFMTPVPVPPSEPDGGTLVCVQFSEDWLPYVLGSLWQLLQPTTWLSDDPSVVRLAQDRASNLIYLFTLASTDKCNISSASSGGEMLNMAFTRFNSDTKHLDFEISPGVWVPLANLTDVPVGSQSGAGSPQPPAGGGVSSDCVVVNANAQSLLVAPVNTGDVITVTSANGAVNDGAVIEWFCPDGSFYFAGSCSGYPALDSSDPIPTAHHMSLIVKIGSNYYPVYPGGAITIPSGVVNQPATFLVNGHTMSTSSGSFSVCYTQTNNQALTGIHHFNFRTSDGGWILDPAVGACPGQYIPGTGWVSLDGNCIGANAGYLTFLKHGAFSETSVRVVYSVAGAGWAGDVDDGSIALGSLNGAPGSYDLFFSGAHTITDHIRFALTTATTGGTVIVTDIYVGWSGSDPY